MLSNALEEGPKENPPLEGEVEAPLPKVNDDPAKRLCVGLLGLTSLTPSRSFNELIDAKTLAPVLEMFGVEGVVPLRGGPTRNRLFRWSSTVPSKSNPPSIEKDTS